jgi:hypothetical protein
MSRRKLVTFGQVGAALLVALYLFVHVRSRSTRGPFAKLHPVDSLDISPNGESKAPQGSEVAVCLV